MAFGTGTLNAGVFKWISEVSTFTIAIVASLVGSIGGLGSVFFPVAVIHPIFSGTEKSFGFWVFSVLGIICFIANFLL